MSGRKGFFSDRWDTALRGYENVVDPFLERANDVPDRVALVHGKAEMSYRSLAQASQKVAAVLADLGVGQGDRVAYILPNRIGLIVLYVAIERMGAVAVPLNFRLIPREIAFLSNSVRASLLVFDDDFEERVETSRPLVDGRTVLVPLSRLAKAAEEQDVPAGVAKACEAGGLSRIQFTGGSTGTPKGVCRTHAADLVEMHAVAKSNGMLEAEHAVALIQCPLEHHGGHSWFMSSLCAGATVVICGKFAPSSIFEQVERHHVTHMILLPPTTYERLVQDVSARRHDVGSVRVVQSAAGAMTPEIAEGIFSTFPNADINYGWGQSESGVGTSMRMTRRMLRAHDRRIGSVGVPMESLQVKIVDDSGAELPDGVAGEAVVCSPAVMSGYFEQKELTRDAFVDGWLRTGDVMERDENGYLYMRARKRGIVKSGGENVFIDEVQTAILRDPQVADCVVFGVPDPVMGEAVAALVQPAPGRSPTKESVLRTCRRYISSYKKPRYVQFVDDLGRDDAGKVRVDEAIKRFNRHRRAVDEKQGL